MADRFDDATQVQSLSCFTRTFNISDALVHSLEGAPGFPRPGAGAGACPAVYPHVYQYVLGQVRSRHFPPPSHHSYTIVPSRSTADASLVRPRRGFLGVKRAAWPTVLIDFWIRASS